MSTDVQLDIEVRRVEPIVLTGMRHKYEDQNLSPLTNFIGSLWQRMAINDPSLKPFADGLRLTDPDPTGGQFGFASYKLPDVATPQILSNVRRQFPVGADWMYQYSPSGNTCGDGNCRLRNERAPRRYRLPERRKPT
jgi:hypothetical protein